MNGDADKLAAGIGEKKGTGLALLIPDLFCGGTTLLIVA